MKKIIFIVLSVAVVAMALASCNPGKEKELQAEIDRLNAANAELAAEVADLKAQIQEKDAEIAADNVTIADLQAKLAELASGKLVLTFEPDPILPSPYNPVPAEWLFQLVFTEIGGVNVHIDKITFDILDENGYNVHSYTNGEVSYDIPANGIFKVWENSRMLNGRAVMVITVSGSDAKGNQVIARGQAKLVWR